MAPQAHNDTHDVVKSCIATSHTISSHTRNTFPMKVRYVCAQNPSLLLFPLPSHHQNYRSFSLLFLLLFSLLSVLPLLLLISLFLSKKIHYHQQSNYYYYYYYYLPIHHKTHHILSRKKKRFSLLSSKIPKIIFKI